MVTIFSPGPSVLMHILVGILSIQILQQTALQWDLFRKEQQDSKVTIRTQQLFIGHVPQLGLCMKAEVGYGEHLVKLCVTSSLFNTVLLES